MRTLTTSICMLICMAAAGCSSRLINDTIRENYDKYEQLNGFPVICYADYEERISYSVSGNTKPTHWGWELEVYWLSENPYNDRFLLIDKNGKGKFVPVIADHVHKVESYKGKKAALYWTEIQEYHKPGVNKQDLAVKVGVKSENSDKINISEKKPGFRRAPKP